MKCYNLAIVSQNSSLTSINNLTDRIPKIRCFTIQNNYNILIMELLGPNLNDLFEYCNKRFSLETVLMLAIQMIDLIEYLHDKGYVHR